MKRRIIAAVFTGMLTVALFPAIAHAEIENPEDYMGIWYANYVIYSDESSERHNVAEYLKDVYKRQGMSGTRHCKWVQEITGMFLSFLWGLTLCMLYK